MKVRITAILVFFVTCSLSSTGQSFADSLWNRFHQLPMDTASVDTMLAGVLKLRQAIKNSPDEERMLHSALSMAKKLHYARGLGQAYNLLGVYYRDASQYSEALSYHEEALKIGKETRDSVVIGYALNSMGVAYRRLDNNEKAFQYHYEALGISTAIGNLRGRLIAMNSIANIRLSMGDYKNAIDEFSQCLELEKQLGNNLGQAINYANLGAAYEGMGALDTAILLYNESLRYNTIEKSDKGIAICYNLLGEAYMKKGTYDVALSYLQKAAGLNDKLRDRINVAENYITMGKIFQMKNRTAAALRYLNRGLQIAQEIGSPSLVVKAYESIGESEKAGGSASNAYTALRLAYEIRDSLFREQATPQMAKLRTLYDLDKKENQIRLLKQENEINRLRLKNNTYLIIAAVILIGLLLGVVIFYARYKSQKNYKVRLEYELQSLRSQMNPHFIFNALNSIDTLIWKRNPEMASSYLVKFSTLMRMTLHNSREKSVPLSVERDFLTLYLQLENFRHSERFTYDITIAPDINEQNVVVPSMVVQPFVENAILHGLSHKLDGVCKIMIRFTRAGNLLICEVEDNGIGRKRAKEMQDEGSLIRQSLGIQVTEERVRLLQKITGNKNLRIQITDLGCEDSAHSGTLVTIKLPFVEEMPAA